jgi:hypothetical protein
MTDESPVFSTRSRFEIGAVLATGILHLVFFEILNAKALFISLALSGWIASMVGGLRASMSNETMTASGRH